MDVGISILVTLVLIVVNGFFSGSEMALVSAKRVVLQKEAEEGSRRAQKALALSEDPDRFLAAIQVAITLVGFFASATAATNLSAPLSSWLSSFGIDWLTAASQVAAPILITLIVSYASIVFGELVPKRLALADAEKMAGAVAGPLTAFSTIASPLVRLTAASSDVVARAMGIKSAAVADRERERSRANEVSVELGRLEVQVENAINAIVGMGAVLDEALQLPEPEDRDAAERTIARLTQQLAGIGPVNEVAMDEYLRLKERADYIGEQVEDLEAARASLKKITAAIERKMRNRFLVDLFKNNQKTIAHFSLNGSGNFLKRSARRL